MASLWSLRLWSRRRQRWGRAVLPTPAGYHTRRPGRRRGCFVGPVRRGAIATSRLAQTSTGSAAHRSYKATSTQRAKAKSPVLPSVKGAVAGSVKPHEPVLPKAGPVKPTVSTVLSPKVTAADHAKSAARQTLQAAVAAVALTPTTGEDVSERTQTSSTYITGTALGRARSRRVRSTARTAPASGSISTPHLPRQEAGLLPPAPMLRRPLLLPQRIRRWRNCSWTPQRQPGTRCLVLHPASRQSPRTRPPTRTSNPTPICGCRPTTMASRKASSSSCQQPPGRGRSGCN